MSENAEEDRAKFVLKPKTFESVNAPLTEEVTKPIDVHAILQGNLATRGAVPPLVLNFEKKLSRRKRDYLILMIAGNALLLLLMSFLPKDPLIRVLGWSGLALYSAGVSWVIWGVMDDY
jgi:hypothetical protein